MNDPKKAPTPGQMANAGFMVAGAITRTLERSNVSFDQLKNFTQDHADEVASRIIKEWLTVTEDPWFEEKKKISLFWKKFFSITIDWSKMTIPVFDPKFKRLEYVASAVTCQQLLDAYAKAFGKDSVWKSWDKALDEYIKEEQSRPTGNYVFAHVGGDEPDKEHLGKSYDDAMNANLKFMTLKEGLISAFRHRFETNRMYDVEGLTRLATLATVGKAMIMCRDAGNGQFNIDGIECDDRNSDFGLREVSF